MYDDMRMVMQAGSVPDPLWRILREDEPVSEALTIRSVVAVLFGTSPTQSGNLVG